ncbi:sulfur oxidation c-type cytochrome SoxX [Archangium sp.]|jgi:sulfur-oxidizing protein SoxX|uniref:sulfur oxidation c-type cytochrome SoxX n=1 Tax=Archangium sp. TaxID=1872627 RepID=UPI002ED958FC
MHQRRVSRPAVAAVVAVLALGGAAIAADKKKKDYRAAAVEVMKASFQTKGQASVDRLNQDEVQATCSQYNASKPVPRELARKLEAAQLATVPYPADGKYLGSWENGEKIAQTGVGKQFSDDPSKPAGGNCYACHQLSPKELSFGTIGPSLYQYGKLRGNSEPILKYTWARLWNAQAFTACSDMPRFGHQGILTEAQLKDVMALLLDPESPVNK